MLITLLDPIELSTIFGMFKYHHKAASRAIKELPLYLQYKIHWEASKKFDEAAHETIASRVFCGMFNHLIGANKMAYYEEDDGGIGFHTCSCDYPFHVNPIPCSKRDLGKALEHFYDNTMTYNGRSFLVPEWVEVVQVVIDALLHASDIDSLDTGDAFNRTEYS